LAPGHYQFHIRLTDAKSVFAAEPGLHLTPAQLEAAAKSTVYCLDHTRGVHFRWLVLNPPLESEINARGGSSGKSTDVSFKGGDDLRPIMKCFHDTCDVVITTNDHQELKFSLHRGETKTVPLDSDIDLSFKDSQ
jgi:hypothetical protein